MLYRHSDGLAASALSYSSMLRLPHAAAYMGHICLLVMQLQGLTPHHIVESTKYSSPAQGGFTGSCAALHAAPQSLHQALHIPC